MINFTKVRFKNFGSFGNNFTEIQLNKAKMVLVSGSNGHGKSFALLDSITFGLFGKPFRKINLPQLVNSINEKDCLVEVEFTIANDSYKVIRGIKPNRFEVWKNGNLLDQHATTKDYQKMLEEQILKMNYKSFTQVVILGSSSFVPFMQLPAADRRAVIEDILDINVFSTMNTILKAKMSTLKEEIADNERKIAILRESIRAQKDLIAGLKIKTDEQVQGNLKEIARSESLIEEKQAELATLTEQIQLVKAKLQGKVSLLKQISKLEILQKQLESNRKKVGEELSFFDNNEVCPTCHQSIDKASQPIHGLLCKKKSKQGELNEAVGAIVTEIETKRTQIEEYEEVSAELESLNTQTMEANSTITACNSYIGKLSKENKAIQSKETEDTDHQKRLVDFEGDLNKNESSKNSLIEEMHYYSVAATLLKDSGIKAKIIRYYLPIINKTINKYLNTMDFFANFTLDEEFNETIKSRHRDAFSYMSFSEGEKMRIDLALLLAWREIARIKNSANTNLLILDEVFDSSLDTAGTEEFMKILHSFGTNSNVFVISHKADQLVDKFEHTMSFEKKNNFSRIAP